MKARHQLMFNGRVVTCRTRRKMFGNDTAYYINDQNKVVKIGRVTVKKIEETVDDNSSNKLYRTHQQTLEDYLSSSGFDSVDNWINEILRLNSKGKVPSYLVFLEVTLKDLTK
jgi:hypothetical protein